MNYHPGQVKVAAKISEETFRHWRKVLPPLQGRKGKNAQFRVGDILALLVIQRITSYLGIKVGFLSPIAEELFKLCNDTAFPKLERSYIYLDIEKRNVSIRSREENKQVGEIYINVDLAPLAVHIRRTLFESIEIEYQQELAFPPAAVKIK